jgi:hypothetical protein
VDGVVGLRRSKLRVYSAGVPGSFGALSLEAEVAPLTGFAFGDVVQQVEEGVV